MDMGSALDIYTAHFGLKERPFSLVPDPDFLFWSGEHQRAYAMLEYGILTRAPITLITGEVGAGKTTLLHHLLRSVHAASFCTGCCWRLAKPQPQARAMLSCLASSKPSLSTNTPLATV